MSAPSPESARALDAAALLSGRALAHARPADVQPLLALLDPQRSGLVLTGTSGMRLAESRRRANGIQCPVICDPAAYLTWRATPQDPFRGPGGPLHGRALESFLKDTCRAGAHAVLTPTGFIPGADIDTLQAVRVIRMLTERHHWRWADVRRWLVGPTRTWRPITEGGTELRPITAIPVTRYRYRGSQIPNPWTAEPA
jgi:hypothetical protein